MKRSRALQSDSSSDSDHSESSNCDRTTKYAGLDTAHTTGLDNASDHQDAMRCFLPPHKDPLSFSTYAEYEVHYNKYHTNRCLECRKNFPSDHLLTVHIEECHDPLVAIKRDKGEHTVSVLDPFIALMLIIPVLVFRRRMRAQVPDAPEASDAHDR